MAKRVQLPKDMGKSRQTKSATRQFNSTRWFLWSVIGAIVLVVAGIVILQAQSLRQPIGPVEVSGKTDIGGAAWGPENATVKIVEYSNFGCPHCRDFALNQGKQLRSEYETTGKVRFEFKPFSLGSQGPDDAANAAECAAAQKRFWDYHDLLFSRVGVAADPFNKAALKQYGAQLGLDAAQFDRCVDSDQFAEKVYQATLEGQGHGVNGTPSFLINGQKVEGAIPYADFKAKVEAALKSAP